MVKWTFCPSWSWDKNSPRPVTLSPWTSQSQALLLNLQFFYIQSWLGVSHEQLWCSSLVLIMSLLRNSHCHSGFSKKVSNVFNWYLRASASWALSSKLIEQLTLAPYVPQYSSSVFTHSGLALECLPPHPARVKSHSSFKAYFRFPSLGSIFWALC